MSALNPMRTAKEETRLDETRSGRLRWKEWGPYLSERAWGTVREDYSAQGSAWEYFPNDHARSRAYRWSEDGLLRLHPAAPYELLDTGVFDDDRYFDVFVEYAEAAPEEILIRISVVNRGTEPAALDLLPSIWFRNVWSWGLESRQPALQAGEALPDAFPIRVSHFDLGERWLLCEGKPELLFTHNETNFQRLFGIENPTRGVKDGINDYIVASAQDAVNPAGEGTKAAARYRLIIGGGETATVKLRLSVQKPRAGAFGPEFDEVFQARIEEADEFYHAIAPAGLSEDELLVQRQAFASLLWSKQFYNYDVRRWSRGEPLKQTMPTWVLSRNS